MKKLAIILLAVLAVGACKNEKKGDELPPASGEGAAPLPEIPDVKATGTGSGTGTGTGADPAASGAVTGTLEPREQVAVAPKASGSIVEIKVDEGSKVKKGDLLFRLDSRDAQLMKRQANTQLNSAKLQLKTAQREYDRIQGLVAQNAVPASQLDALEAQVDGAKLAIAGANNSIAMANKAIGDATVRSPISGVVIQKLMSVGEYATMMPPSPVVVLQDQSTLELKFGLPERSLASTKTGDPVTVSVPSQGIMRIAKISQISPMVDPRTRTVRMTALIDNCDGSLRPGLAAEVTVGATPGATPAPSCDEPAAKKKPAQAKKGKAP